VHDAPFLLGETPLIEHGQIDPGKPRVEARAPDHIGDIEHATIVEQRFASAHTRDPGNALDVRRAQIRRLDAHQWPAVRQHLRTHLAAHRCFQRHDAVKHDAQNQSHQDQARGQAIDAEGDVADVSA
jgi:hypothetical protein